MGLPILVILDKIMAKPVDIKSISQEALDALVLELGTSLTAVEIQAAFEAALAASEPIAVTVVGGSPVPFLTGTDTALALTVTQLTAASCPNGVILRADEDFFIYSTSGGTDGFLVYEGDDIRMTSVTDVSQIWVKSAKNKPLTLWWMTI